MTSLVRGHLLSDRVNCDVIGDETDGCIDKKTFMEKHKVVLELYRKVEDAFCYYKTKYKIVDDFNISGFILVDIRLNGYLLNQPETNIMAIINC